MSSRKRANIEKTDYTARSPKRRKFGTTSAGIQPGANAESSSPGPSRAFKDKPTYSTRLISEAEQLTLPERFHLGKDVWPALAILKERKRRGKVEYQLEWESHPLTGEVWEPTWEGKSNVGDDLIDVWERSKTSTKTREAGERTYEPSQAIKAESEDIHDSPQATLLARQKRTRPLIVDSFSIISTPEPAAAVSSNPPSLYRESESSAEDDFGPDSPSFEIAETQAHSSLSTSDPRANFTLEIPLQSISDASKESILGAQLQHSISQILSSSQAPDSSGEARRPYSPELTTPLLGRDFASGQDSPRISSTHQSLLQALSSPLAQPEQVQIAASSVRKASQIDQLASSGPIIQESSAATESQLEVPSNPGDHSEPNLVVLPQCTISEDLIKKPQPSGPFIAEPAPPHTPAHNFTASSVPPNSGPANNAAQEPSSPWTFESQLPEVRRAVASPAAKGRLRKSTHDLSRSTSPTKMDGPALRQSPRLQAATPVSRTRSPQRATQLRRAQTPQAFGEPTNSEAVAQNAVTSPLATAPPHVADYTSPGPSQLSLRNFESDLLAHPQPTYYPAQIPALPIQQSIEDEPSSSTSMASKASSSQASLLNERVIPQIDGVSLPTQPVIGPAEYLLGLPAEGKVQSVYTDLIDLKRKLIVKFIHRRGSVGSANGSTSRTRERNTMIELMDSLQDTTSHIDLGMPGFTQFSIRSEEEKAYAEYSGSKFVLLGELVSMLYRVDCTIVVACKSGPIQDLLADYLALRQIRVRRHDRPPSARAGTPEALRDTLKIDIISTTADFEGQLSGPPALMIAFDSSFDNQSPHIRRIRELHSKGRDQPLAVVHLLVTNSAEHVDRCLRKAMPSPQRLKLLVRGAYLARQHLGAKGDGRPDYEERVGDRPMDRPMGINDQQRILRKSPNRRIQRMAQTVARAALSADFDERWMEEADPFPEVHYDDMDDTPPKLSENITAAGTAAPTPRDGRMRTRSPASRSGTPMGKKRMLDMDAASSLLHKRQRLTPMRDITPTRETSHEHAKIEQLQQQLEVLTVELAAEKKARLEAEASRNDAAQELAQQGVVLQQWQKDHADLLRRYEKQREHNRHLYKENKRAAALSDKVKEQAEKVRETNVTVRGENVQLKKDLADARNDLKNSGGDTATLEIARYDARTAKERVQTLERSLENTKRDFEFTRQQYQQASNRAAELVTQNDELEAQTETLKVKASGEARLLREMAAAKRESADAKELDKVKEEKRVLEVILKKMDAEIATLKKGRGVQTRGSSAQPPNSPGLGGFNTNARRSRQASPAVGVPRPERLAVPTLLGRD